MFTLHRNILFLAVLPIVILACATKYSVRSAKPEIALQWPYQPMKAKVTYLHAIYGFQQGSVSKSVLRAVTGTNKNQTGGFITPVSIATNMKGDVVVADTGCSCIHLFLEEKNRYVRIVRADKQKIVSPVSVAFDESNNFYVSDSTGFVFLFSSDGKLITSITKAGSDPLRRPTGLAYSAVSKMLYVVDTLANRVYAFQNDGHFAFSFGRRGDKEGEFNFPTHIWFESGTLYVTDSLNFRIQMFDAQGKFLGAFGNHGDGSGDLAMPKGIAVDKDGVIYLADSLFDNVQLFNQQGKFLLTIGKRGLQFGEFWLPSGVFLDQNDQLYVCDTYNRRVQVFRITEHYEE